MHNRRGVTITMMVIGTILASAIPSGATEKTTTDKTPVVGEETQDKSTGKASKDGRAAKKRRSSGKSGVEDKGDGKSQPKAQDSSEGTPGTTLMFRSDGKGNSGEPGK